MSKYTGGIVTNTEVIPAGKFTDSTASGVWSIQEALMYTKSEIYPHPDNGAGPLSFARALFAHGLVGAQQTTVEYVEIATTANATDFGDLSVARFAMASFGSNSRGVFAGGEKNNPSAAEYDTIDFFTFSTIGNSSDFGDITADQIRLAGCSSVTRGLIGGGQRTGSTNVIEYVTIATEGNAQDFGDLTVARYRLGSSGSVTRGVWYAGNT
jgi:hypothetical protein